jgi:putative ABC transport system permease protein
MFNRDRWIEILEVLTSNMFRTILTAFGVFWGILILMILLAAGKGLENGIRSDFGDIATNTMFMWTQTTTKPYKGLPQGRRFNFKISDIGSIKQNIPNMRFVSPRNGLGATVIRGLNTESAQVFGDYPEIIQQDPISILEGRFVNHSDINEKRKVAVIGEGLQKSLYDAKESPIGTYIKVQGVNFLVIGVYNKKENGGSDNEQKDIYVPFTSFSQAFNRADNVGWMALTAVDGASISQLKEDIIALVKENRKIHPEDMRAIGHFDLYEQYRRVESLFGAMSFIAYFVGILVLLSGIIGVSNIMLIVVKERTKEIGIRRALGESPWSIKLQVLLESITLTLISGIAGIVMGTLFIYAVNYVLDMNGPVDMFMNPSVSLGVVLGALGILIGAGILAGFIPANGAIKVKPVDALRAE